MNGIPMKLDYSKTINEQLTTFEYYKDRYCSYELQIMKLLQENQKYKEVFDNIKKYIEPLITDRDNQQCYPISWYSKDVLSQILKEVE